MESFNRIKLKNGLRLIFVPQPSSLATTVMVLVEAGSKYESKDKNGLSHFLEHMCFKGTIKRPRPIDIAGELDGLGAQYNAFTSHEFTSYYAKAKNEAFDKILDLVADLYLNPTFEEQEIEKEKGVIIEELNMYEDIPQRKVQELFMEIVYGDQPAGWPIGGQKDVIRKITRDDFTTYRNMHYLPQSTIVVVAGAHAGEAEQKNIADRIESYFTSLHEGGKGGKVKVIEAQDKPSELVRFKESDQTHFILGFRAFDVFDKRRYALQVLSDILGGGMSSRLFQKVREEMGAAYYVNASPDLFSDHGLIAAAAGVDHTKLEAVISAVLREYSRFKDEPVPIKELERAKDHLVGNLFLSVETSDELGYFYGGQEVMGVSLETPQVAAEKIKLVTADEIQAVAKELFVNNRLNLALIGPFKDRTFNAILKI
ncbi:insulinase family protein [Candidatus Jorgensenbacteria bacterium]|nr:insulinase family protein [Candidatus Jorgensenbacteria bacterium]